MGICSSICVKEKSRKYFRNDLEKELKNRNFDDLKVFTFDGIITKCFVTDVYDGDTVTLVFIFRDEVTKVKFRMLGFDAPEMRPNKEIEYCDEHKNIKNKKKIDCNICEKAIMDDEKYREKCKKAAILVRDYLKKQILNKVVWVKFVREEKYGRSMGELYIINLENKENFEEDNLSVNDLLINRKLVKKYDGKKKDKFTVEELDSIISMLG